jgi:hypothetical protein
VDTPDTEIKLFGYEDRSMAEHDRFQEWRKENWNGGFMSGLLLDENGLYEYESPLVPMRIEGDCSAIGTGAQAAHLRCRLQESHGRSARTFMQCRLTKRSLEIEVFSEARMNHHVC